MRLKMTLFALLMVCAVPLAAAQQPKYDYPFQNPDLPVNARVKDLLSRMTLQEKIDALGSDPSVPRLGGHPPGG